MAGTFQHRTEQALQRESMEADEQASDRENQGMALVGQVAGGILHDFNNILTVITGTIDILAQAVVGKPELAAVARLIDEAASRGARLTSQLLAFARGRPPHPCEVDIDELLTDVGRLLRPTLGVGIEVHAVVAPGTPTAFADPGQLMAALLCLAIMARNALADGGALSFEASSVERAAPDAPGQVTEACVVVTLTASANSQSTVHADRIFADIAIVDDFVKRSNGRLKVDDLVVSGARVEIALPRGKGLLA
jgi:nitrogen-specific signal transduction histidine kinase